MGHAHHFLSRLDRVSQEHTELALSLYQDDELLRHVLSSVRLPDGAERVAISLDHPQEGPFLVVTREGRFVTCLGAGMHPGETPIVTRGQLDGLTAKVTTYRARVDARKKLLGPEGEGGALLTRIIDAGDNLSREEFTALASLQPILAREFLRFFVQITIDAEESKRSILRVLRKTDRLKPTNRPLLDAYWKQFWALGHLAVLCSMGGDEALGPLPNTHGVPTTSLISMATIRHGSVMMAVKGAWATGKLGRGTLAHYKRQHAEAKEIDTLIERCVSLFAIGLRHAKLRAEVRKALARPIHDPELAKWGRPVAQNCGAIYDDLDSAIAYQQHVGQGTFAKLARRFPAGSPYRFENADDVPVPLAMSLAVNLDADFWSDARLIQSLLLLLPWVARAAPEDLYLPAEVLKVIRDPWTPEATLRLLETWAFLDKARERPSQDGPSRSGPCPCGSGKKYKRCCGDKRDG